MIKKLLIITLLFFCINNTYGFIIPVTELSSDSSTYIPVNSYIDGTSFSLGNPVTTGRTWFNMGHRARIKKRGTIYSLCCEIQTKTYLLDSSLKFAIFRWDGSAWDSVVVSDAIANADISVGWNEFTSAILGNTFCTTTILRGDIIAYHAKGDGGAWVGMFYGTEGSDNDNWCIKYATDDQTSQTNYTPGSTFDYGNFNIYIKMSPPMIIGAGDSLMRGTTASGDAHCGFSSDLGTETWTDVGLTDNIIHCLSGFNETYLGGMNHGIGSSTTTMWATTGSDYITTYCINYKPRYCIIELGVNDISTGVSWDTARANYINIFQNLLANRIVPIMLTILQWPNGSEAQQASIKTWNNNIKKLCNDMGIICIDAYRVLADASDDTNRNATLFGANTNVHPVKEAYVAVATEILMSATNNYLQQSYIYADPNGSVDIGYVAGSAEDIATETKQDTIDTVVDGVKAVTDNLPDSGNLTTIVKRSGGSRYD